MYFIISFDNKKRAPMKNLVDIEIETIHDVIPGLLINKFNLLGLKTLGDILDLKTDDLSNAWGAGTKCNSDLKSLQQKIKTNPQEYLDFYDSVTKIHELPIKKPDQGEFHLRHLEETILDYVNLINKEAYKGIFLYSFGLNGNKVYTSEEISSMYNITNERVRQIKQNLMYEVGELLQGGLLDKYKCRICNPLVSLLKKLTDKLKSSGIFTFEQLKNILYTEFNYHVNSSKDVMIRLILESLGMEFGRKYDCNFTKAEFIYCDSTQKYDFISTARQTLHTLKYVAMPVTEMDAIIEVKRNNGNLKDEYIRIAINSLPEIEILPNGNQNFYQVRFESLGNARNRTFRILKERGDTMYIDEIVSELNRRSVNSDTPVVYTRFSFVLTSDDRFKPKQKTGFWDLTEWNLNTDRIEDLVRSALYLLDRPSTTTEIINIIKVERPQLKDSSIRSLISRDCLRVEGEKFILPEWTQRYPNLSLTKRRRLIITKEREHITLLRQRIIEHLNKQNSQVDLAVKILASVLPTSPKFNKQALYKIFREKDYFNRFEEDGKMFVQLIHTPKPLTLF